MLTPTELRKARKGGPLYFARIWKMGKSTVFPLAKLLLQALNARAGDHVLIRVHPPYVTFRVANAEKLIPSEAFTREDLPPEFPRRLRPIDPLTKVV